MEKTYSFVMRGTASRGQTWRTTGYVNGDIALDLFDQMMRETFLQLTNGKARFGHPGIGCDGPYSIDCVLIELIPGAADSPPRPQ